MTVEKTILRKISTPPLIAEQEQFLIKYAENEQEIEATMRLRYEVFNLEQGKGLESAAREQIDRDEFDEHCLHLIIVEKKTSRIVGTYRVHLGVIARNHLGFYSAREYHIQGIDRIMDEIVEVGRSCVHPDFRNGSVIALLWNGIGATLTRSGMRYLLGCVSLETVDPTVGWTLYEYFKRRGKLCSYLNAVPAKAFELPPPDPVRMNEFLEEKNVALLQHIPPLFKGYLRLGVMICGRPVLDQEFGSIDFLVLLDHSLLPEKYVKHFFKQS
ncbi:MAG: GNAT family N-acetyltransferase [Victivallaceae bacterium]|nr:GNAT family N-acetyltransferase [Victivallaceae bacterium]